MAEEVYYEGSEDELGISILGITLVVLSLLVSVVLFLDPSSSTYDVQVGSVILLAAATLPISWKLGFRFWTNEPNLRRTLLLGLIGASVVSVMVTVTYALYPMSTVQTSSILIAGLPAVFEDLLFRVCLYFLFLRLFGSDTKAKVIATLLQAFFFSLYHFARDPDPVYSVVLFFGGVIFMLVFLISKNVLSAMMAHAIVNLRPFWLEILLSPFGALLLVGVVIYLFIRRSKS